MGKFLFGIDVGFGDVKVAFSNSDQQQKVLKFPTAVATSNSSIKLEGSERTYLYKGKNFILGREAVHHPNVLTTRNLDFLFGYSPLLIYRAMEMAAARYHMDVTKLMSAKKAICVGLPIKHYMEKREQMADLLETFEVSGLQFRFENNIRVIAQGQGVLMDFIRCAELKHRKWYGRARTLTILDMGYNTIDVLCVDNGRPSGQFSGMLTGDGICRLVEWLRNDIQRHYDIGELSEQEIKKAIEDRYIISTGKRIDLTDLIDAKTAEYTEYLSSKLDGRFGDFMRRSERLIVAGGGAYYVKKAFRDKYVESPDFLYFAPNAEYANARGYLECLKVR